MLASELIAALTDELSHHGDQLVFVTWEGLHRELHREYIYLSDGIVIIDGEECARRDRYIDDECAAHADR